MKELNRLVSVSFFIFAAWLALMPAAASAQSVSGTLSGGFRILEIDPTRDTESFTVYRGDYIKFLLTGEMENPMMEFPTLKQKKQITRDLEKSPYFKMKQTGVVPFQLGHIKGQVTVIEYEQAKYQTMTAAQADQFIREQKPFILDVRTPREYAAGHLEDSTLIPVQVLAQRLNELKAHKGNPILVYCATGNRSTVASKILVDSGFSNITNLRYGIVDWYKKKFKVVH